MATKNARKRLRHDGPHRNLLPPAKAHQLAGVTPIAASVTAPPIEVVPASVAGLKLDLGCGLNPRPGFEGVDNLAPAQHKVDLLKFPWPWDDDSAEELNCSHFIEHIDARNVEPRDLVDANPMSIERWVGVDLFFAFFDECHRVLRHEGKLHVITPSARNNRAFQDPTHRRFIVQETFLYLHKAWRDAVGLSHYRVRCDFAGSCNPSITAEVAQREATVQEALIRERWNATIDWHATLVAIKR